MKLTELLSAADLGSLGCISLPEMKAKSDNGAFALYATSSTLIVSHAGKVYGFGVPDNPEELRKLVMTAMYIFTAPDSHKGPELISMREGFNVYGNTPSTSSDPDGSFTLLQVVEGPFIKVIELSSDQIRMTNQRYLADLETGEGKPTLH